MTNPYQEPEKGCVLCKVEVDFKNIQVNIYIMTWQLQAAQPMCLVSVTLGSFSFFLLCLLQLLSQFISPYTGRIYGRHITGNYCRFFFVPKHVVSVQMLTVDCCFFLGLCGRKQKEISKAIKKAQKLGKCSENFCYNSTSDIKRRQPGNWSLCNPINCMYVNYLNSRRAARVIVKLTFWLEALWLIKHS